VKTLISRSHVAIAAISIGAITILISSAAHAVLGGPPGSPIQANPAGTIVRAENEMQYSIRESVLASGTSVREYVARDGVVFAVAWSGPRIPNLRELLGKHFNSYVGALEQRRAAGSMSGSAAVYGGDAVVRSVGHMGAFAGLAYLPARLPPSVSPSDLQ